MNDDLKAAIEAIKLRSPIEEIVRERVPGLRRAGALWHACCPFHQEKTPSFKVDPRRATWRCFGACADGGDVIKFVMRSNNVEFIEALEILGSRCGVALPERREVQEQRDALEPAYELMARTEQFYKRCLRSPEGAAGLAYMRGRGLTDTTIDAFGIGFSPATGNELVAKARSGGIAIERLVELGLVRVDASDRAYDFFRGRVMFPVRDFKGRTVGFGARNLSGDPPKYVNTPETALFHKGRVIYALDFALEHVRRSGHLILVEGYTDVMAAHQVGLRTVVAVLGTATTEDHTGLIRKSGARRISLLFDGDDAGRKATLRALDGLLPLEVAIDVVRLVGDKDPCDLLVREGAAPLERHLAEATDWFAFLCEWLGTLQGDARFKAVDQVLALLARIPKPIQRDERIAALARSLALPVEGVREQFLSLTGRRRDERARTESEQVTVTPQAAVPTRAVDRRLSAAYRAIAGAALRDLTLAENAGAYAPSCPDADVARVLTVLGELAARNAGAIGDSQVFDALIGEAAQNLISPLLEQADTAESALASFQDNARCIDEIVKNNIIRAQLARQRAGSELEESELHELSELLRSRGK